MQIETYKLRDLPRINWTVPFEWMTKMSNEDLKKWEDELIEEIKSSIILENRSVTKSEIDFRVQKEASMIERDYQFIRQGLK
jgi:hypothetical protein